MEDCPIYALSSGTGGAIAIVRISGKGAGEILKKIFRSVSGGSRTRFPHSRMIFGHLVAIQSGDLIDEIYAVRFDAGKSFTGDELVELHCHGSSAVLRMVFRELNQAGARAAEPGEFSRRAFLNGRIGLSQAEAIRELIESESEAEASVAIKNLTGTLKGRVEQIRDELVDAAAHLEATLDYPEEEVPFLNVNEIYQRIDSLLSLLSQMGDSYERFRLCREGILVAILGRPNVGKSSLLNSLLKEERAIVTEIEGTTRDTIEESFFLKGVRFKLVDTAGLRETSDQVEQIGVKRSLEFEEKADLRFYLYDVSQPVTLFEKEQDNVFHVLNKKDLGVHSENQSLIHRPDCFLVSLKSEEGLDLFLDAVAARGAEYVKMPAGDIPVLTSSRQKQCVEDAAISLKEFRDAVEMEIPVDIALVHLYEARDHLGQITGKIVTEDIVDRIFEKFCIGK